MLLGPVEPVESAIVQPVKPWQRPAVVRARSGITGPPIDRSTRRIPPDADQVEGGGRTARVARWRRDARLKQPWLAAIVERLDSGIPVVW